MANVTKRVYIEPDDRRLEGLLIGSVGKATISKLRSQKVESAKKTPPAAGKARQVGLAVPRRK